MIKHITRQIALLTCLSFLSAVTPAFAADNAFEETFKNAFYGGAVGSLIGAAFMVFAKKPSDHVENIGYGAAAGILVGAAYGVAKSARSLAEINNGSIRIALPTITPDLVESPATGQVTIAWKADLLRGSFN